MNYDILNLPKRVRSLIEKDEYEQLNLECLPLSYIIDNINSLCADKYVINSNLNYAHFDKIFEKVSKNFELQEYISKNCYLQLNFIKKHISKFKVDHLVNNPKIKDLDKEAIIEIYNQYSEFLDQKDYDEYLNKYLNKYNISRALKSSSGRASLAAMMANPIRDTLDYRGIARRILMVDEIPNIAPTYDRDIDIDVSLSDKLISDIINKQF